MNGPIFPYPATLEGYQPLLEVVPWAKRCACKPATWFAS